ncbi:MAG: hypothetical protein JOZ81_33240 [Chloroflexi bacterium]|nr:hypothetical protein [Chloroflexota bacterium]
MTLHVTPWVTLHVTLRDYAERADAAAADARDVVIEQPEMLQALLATPPLGAVAEHVAAAVRSGVVVE